MMNTISEGDPRRRSASTTVSTARTASPPSRPGEPDREAHRFHRWSARFNATLTRCRGLFGGDLDQFLIYMVFVEAEAARTAVASRQSAPAPGGLNALSVAEITSVPRETTRRKLRILCQRGLLTHGRDGLHYLGPATCETVEAELRRLFLT